MHSGRRRSLVLQGGHFLLSSRGLSIVIAPQQRHESSVLGLLASLKQCKTLVEGREIHARAMASRQSKDKFVASALVSMYARCGSVLEARKIFDELERRDVVTWNSLLLGYVDNDDPASALELFARMDRGRDRHRCDPNARTFVAVLKACAILAAREQAHEADGRALKLAALKQGVAIHSQLARASKGMDIFVASALVTMYAKCGSVIEARAVFDRMPLHDLVSSTALMLGYAENSQESLALELFSSFSFHSQGIAPDATLFVAALKACSSLAVKEEAREIDGKLVKVESLERAMAIHSLAAKFGCEFNLYVATTLVDVYAKCKSMVSSQRVFDRMPCHNAVSWTSLMMGYIDAGNGELAIDLFSRMELASSSSSIDAATFVSALKACSSLSEREEARELDGRLVKVESLKRGVEIHARAEKSGWELDASVGISLVDMYAKCGCLVEARRVFDRLSSSSVVPLTSLTLGYAENGQGELAVELLESKVCEQGGGLDPPTFVAALKACSSMAGKETGELVHGRLVKLKALEKGMGFHSQAMDRSFETDTYVANTLVDMYARCGSMVDSRGVFDRMVARNSPTAASWNALLLGYSENGEEDLSLELFPRMLESEAMANSRTFGVLLKACGAAVALDKLQAIEARIYRAGLEVDETLATSLVDVYGKCGDMIRARCVFDWIVAAGGGDLVLWTALIAGYSRVGKWKLVFESFSSMEDRGLAANAVTLVCLLTACSHSGLVERGRSYFRDMVPKFGISPGVEHLSCMVDLLSRANHLDEAVEMAKSMPAGESGVAWMTILGACSKWRNVRIGEIAFGRLVESDSHSAGAYDLMANIYGRT